MDYPLDAQTITFLKEHQLFEHDEIQQIQLQHRLRLVSAFDLPKGGRILEIGCGQGDTTMALAHATGEKGQIVAVDKASREYGAPFTLGEATDHILQSSLGKRITFHLDTDLHDVEVDVPFDAVVLSHCSWYFHDPKELLGVFQKLRRLTKRICFAEWDIAFTEMAQRSHFCAVSLIALYSQFVENDSNVQNLFHKVQIRQLLEEAGFTVEKQAVVDASFLPDGKWEMSYANSIRVELEAAAPAMIPLLTSYYALMNEPQGEVCALDSFVITAS